MFLNLSLNFANLPYPVNIVWNYFPPQCERRKVELIKIKIPWVSFLQTIFKYSAFLLQGRNILVFIRKEISVMSRKSIPFWSKCNNPTAEWADGVKYSWKSWQSCFLDKLSSYPGMLSCEPRSRYHTNVILCWQSSLSTYTHITSFGSNRNMWSMLFFVF